MKIMHQIGLIAISYFGMDVLFLQQVNNQGHHNIN